MATRCFIYQCRLLLPTYKYASLYLFLGRSTRHLYTHIVDSVFALHCMAPFAYCYPRGGLAHAACVSNMFGVCVCFCLCSTNRTHSHTRTQSHTDTCASGKILNTETQHTAQQHTRAHRALNCCCCCCCRCYCCCCRCRCCCRFKLKRKRIEK